MLLVLLAQSVPVTPELKTGIERRLRFAADRFQGHLREIAVRLRDINGPKGGIDILCTMSARFHNGDRVRVEQRSARVMSAIGVSAKRLRRILARRIDRNARSWTVQAGGAPEYWIG